MNRFDCDDGVTMKRNSLSHPKPHHNEGVTTDFWGCDDV